MSNNIFSGKRFMLLWKQHFIQNTQLLLVSTVAYVGLIFFILSIAQIGNDLIPHGVENFQGFMLAFVGVAGVVYVGHSFPAFRNKEKSINYLTLPGSTFEKFLFEFISRIGILLILLPLLFWITFHLQGYFLGMFTEYVFEPVGFNLLTGVDVSDIEGFGWLASMIITGVLFGFVLAFTGAAMFVKQPLIKTLFALAVLVIFYSVLSYIIIEHLGVGLYNPPDVLYLLPNNEIQAFKFFTALLILGNIIMLFVAYRKLKEKEV